MAKKKERKRVAALECDPHMYRREVPDNAFEASKLNEAPIGEEVSLVGRLMLSDKSGAISRLGVYATLNNTEVIELERIGSGGISIRAYLVRNEENAETMNTLIHVGDVVVLHGQTEIDQGSGGVVFVARQVEVLSKATADVYDKNVDFRKRSNLNTQRHLQLLRDESHLAEFQAYTRVYRGIRQYLYAQGYEEVRLPILQETFEAGLATPFRTHVVDRDRDMYLRLTAELFLRKLMIAGFTKSFEIGTSFRNQGATPSMNPVFTILELYRAYAKEGELELVLQNMIQAVLMEVYGHTIIPTGDGNIDCSGIWETVDLNEELCKLTGMRYSEEASAEKNATILDALGVARPVVLNNYTVGTEMYVYFMSTYREPVFLKGLPASTSPLNKLRDDGSTIDETLLVINGMLVADIVNAERDPRVLRARMEAQSVFREHDEAGVNEELLQAMTYGLPPCRGIGMGLERFLMLLFNKKEIREVELFPIF